MLLAVGGRGGPQRQARRARRSRRAGRRRCGPTARPTRTRNGSRGPCASRPRRSRHSTNRTTLGLLLPDRHAVGDADRPLRQVELGLEHQGVVDVAPARRQHAARLRPAVGSPPGRSARTRGRCRRAGGRSRPPSRSAAGRASRSIRRDRRARPCGCRRSGRSPRSAGSRLHHCRPAPSPRADLRRAGARPHLEMQAPVPTTVEVGSASAWWTRCEHARGGERVADPGSGGRPREDDPDDETVRLDERAAGVARPDQRLHHVHGPHRRLLAVDVEPGGEDLGTHRRPGRRRAGPPSG